MVQASQDRRRGWGVNGVKGGVKEGVAIKWRFQILSSICQLIMVPWYFFCSGLSVCDQSFLTTTLHILTVHVFVDVRHGAIELALS